MLYLKSGHFKVESAVMASLVQNICFLHAYVVVSYHTVGGL